MNADRESLQRQIAHLEDNLRLIAERKSEHVEQEQDYSELSPYEIEDAEYEEVRKDKD